MLPIPGTSNPTHLEEELNAAAIDLTANEVDDITRLVTERTVAGPSRSNS
jgi:aryl-alcohol dehydrogenase-like predicted oxidoreductase